MFYQMGLVASKSYNIYLNSLIKKERKKKEATPFLLFRNFLRWMRVSSLLLGAYAKARTSTNDQSNNHTNTYNTRRAHERFTRFNYLPTSILYQRETKLTSLILQW